MKEVEASAYITASSVTDIFYITRKETHDIIITMNYKDYEDALLPIITPAAWIEMIDHTKKNP